MDTYYLHMLSDVYTFIISRFNLVLIFVSIMHELSYLTTVSWYRMLAWLRISFIPFIHTNTTEVSVSRSDQVGVSYETNSRCLGALFNLLLCMLDLIKTRIKCKVSLDYGQCSLSGSRSCFKSGPAPSSMEWGYSRPFPHILTYQQFPYNSPLRPKTENWQVQLHLSYQNVFICE